MGQTVFAMYTAWVSQGLMIEAGQPYDADDVADVMRKFPDAFTDTLENVPGRERVETATAAPGEVRRGPGRPRNDAA